MYGVSDISWGVLERDITHPQIWETDTDPSTIPRLTSPQTNHHPAKHKPPLLPLGP